MFAQMGRGRPETRVGDRWLWASHVELHDAKHKLLMARQKLGGIPPCRGRNYILAKFLLSQYPVRLESLTTDGQQTLTDIKSGSYGLASSALVQFVQKKLTRLRLTWAFQTPNGGTDLRHIVLLMDGGRFMMAWLRDGKRRAEFYVADPAVYMGVEGRKYPKDTFLDRTVPAYLVHQDLDRIRNCLDLMLDDIADGGEPICGICRRIPRQPPSLRGNPPGAGAGGRGLRRGTPKALVSCPHSCYNNKLYLHICRPYGRDWFRKGGSLWERKAIPAELTVS